MNSRPGGCAPRAITSGGQTTEGRTLAAGRTVRFELGGRWCSGPYRGTAKWVRTCHATLDPMREVEDRRLGRFFFRVR